MKCLLSLFLLSSFLGCEEKESLPEPEKRLELRFLDSYVIPAGTTFENTEIGGLSGIDYSESQYYLICDQASNPRFYKVNISIENNQIDTLVFTQVVELNENTSFFNQNVLDMEAIRFDGENLILSSEGSIDSGKDPAVFEITPEGEFVSSFTFPDYFKAQNPNHPRNNGVFEGTSESWDGKGVWVSIELPLILDGPAPQPEPTVSPIRITYFEEQTQSAKKQFAYLLEPIAKPPLLPFYINGVSEILNIGKNKFLILERGFSAGYGMQGNTIRIFKVNISEVTNTLEMDSLAGKTDGIVFAEKRLLFDFEMVRDKLPGGVIDNVEGMCFGPELQNGNKSLLLVSDNNFNSMGPQLNQVILMEITEK